MVDDDLDGEPDVSDEPEFEDDEVPFSLDEEADGTGDDEDGEDIDLDVALAVNGDGMDDADDGDDEDADDGDDEDAEDEDDEEPVREGEFVCNGCHMVFRLTAMADKSARLCRDCA